MTHNIFRTSMIAIVTIGLMCSCKATGAQNDASVTDGAWHGAIEAGGQRIATVIHIDAAAKRITLDVPQQGAKDILCETDWLSGDSIAFSHKAMDMKYHGRIKADRDAIEGIFEQHGLKFVLDFERGEYVAEPERISPQEPQPPFSYTTREVSFSNPSANAVLKGTLTYPDGFKTGTKVPVVLMITGGGNLHRGNTKPFRVIADHLAHNGIASLHYDKRGNGESTGDFAAATIADLAADAEEAVKYLKSQGDFSEIGVLGHSEGGSIAYMLGSRGMADFLVTMAGPATRMDEILSYQLNAMMQASGVSSNPAISVTEARLMVLQQENTPYNRNIIDLDLAVYVRQITCPVFALVCDKDLNVDPKATLESLNKNLQKNPKNQIKVYENLNHIFQHCNPDNPNETTDKDELIAPDVPIDIAQWIHSCIGK